MVRRFLPAALLVLAGLVAAGPAVAQGPGARARDLGITFGGSPGAHNAITDVAGVTVGQVTLVRGEGALVVGQGPVRTGVTAVQPRGGRDEPVFAAVHALNGNGEMTGTIWIRESGLLAGPVMITNTHSVGAVHEGVIAWSVQRGLEAWSLPVVAETYDGFLNDINGFHVQPEHAVQALDSARGGAVAEGNVGGGTGMVCHGFKGGIGTASRVLPAEQGGYTVGVLVQCNYGSRRLFSVEGVPVGLEINDPALRPCRAGDFEPAGPWFRNAPRCAAPAEGALPDERLEGMGSIIVVVATDAPLLPHQLDRVARRVPLAIGKMGGLGENSSGDIFLAFSTQATSSDSAVVAVRSLDNDRLNPVFEATVQATQEAILNALLSARTMTGADGIRIHALPHDRLRAAMRKYGR
jgi:L-aminopeptidase/D-esterase-like protein